MVVALLSQAAWVLRWSGDSSPMAAAMLALVVVNAGMMAAAVLRPAAYARRRQGLVSDPWAAGTEPGSGAGVLQQALKCVGGSTTSAAGPRTRARRLRCAGPCRCISAPRPLMQLMQLAFRRHIPPQALASHVAHKLAQLLVTVLPPAGAVFASAFNPTVALLESSGLAQVWAGPHDPIAELSG